MQLLIIALLATIACPAGERVTLDERPALQVFHPPAKRPPPLPYPWPSDWLEEQEEVRSA